MDYMVKLGLEEIQLDNKTVDSKVSAPFSRVRETVSVVGTAFDSFLRFHHPYQKWLLT